MPKDVADELGLHLMELDDLWAQADFITLHTPLTPDTKNLINDATIAKVR
jgi:D-3-phosphoglycerate dehydrogenase / 2-oxoglutarate reductase